MRHVLANAQQHRIALERLDRHEQASETGTVLVVEDEPLILMSTVDMVEDLGYTVLGASSAEAALSILETETIDVILTDVGLPGMSGTELARKVWERRPGVQIVFSSGDNNAKYASGLEDALKLPKLFSLEQLGAILAQARSWNRLPFSAWSPMRVRTYGGS